jgi:hypothetical protein
MLPKEAFGTIVAAVIAALISLIGLVISKESKVSEFRQAWIDSLRADVAAIITHANAIHGAYLANFSNNVTLWKDAREDFVNLNTALARIRLRLNPTKEPHISMLKALAEHEALFSGKTTPPDFSKLESLDRRVLDCTQIVLKQEWERVKSGEPFYRVARATAGVLVLVGLFYLCISGYFERQNRRAEQTPIDLSAGLIPNAPNPDTLSPTPPKDFIRVNNFLVQIVRLKYPAQYRDLSDAELGQRILRKYPQCSALLELPESHELHDSQDVLNLPNDVSEICRIYEPSTSKRP